MWTNLRVRNSRSAWSAPPPQYCEIYLQDLNQVPTVNIGEKSHHASRRRRGKETIVKLARGLVLNKACPQGQVVNQSLTDMGEGEYPTPDPSHPAPLKGGGKNKKYS